VNEPAGAGNPERGCGGAECGDCRAVDGRALRFDSAANDGLKKLPAHLALGPDIHLPTKCTSAKANWKRVGGKPAVKQRAWR